MNASVQNRWLRLHALVADLSWAANMQEQTVARALMAESSLQSVNAQLESQQTESQDRAQLLQKLFESLAQASSSCPASPAWPQGPEPCSLNRQLNLGMPDQAMVQLIVLHVQAVASSNATQQQQLSMLTQQLQHYSAERTRTVEVLQAAAQHRPQSSAVSQVAEETQSAQVPESAPTTAVEASNLAQLADTVAVMIRDSTHKATQSHAQVEQLTQQLSLTAGHAADADARATASSDQSEALCQQLARTQEELQQVATCFASPAFIQVLAFVSPEAAQECLSKAQRHCFVLLLNQVMAAWNCGGDRYWRSPCPLHAV